MAALFSRARANKWKIKESRKIHPVLHSSQHDIIYIKTPVSFSLRVFFPRKCMYRGMAKKFSHNHGTPRKITTITIKK